MKNRSDIAHLRENRDININEVISDNESYNYFYDSVSVFFRVISFLIFGLLLVFVVSSAFLSAESFSYDNLDYIMRNFALTLEENRDTSRQPIRYNPDLNRSFSLFGEGLVVCGSTNINIFSPTGRQTCSEYHSYTTPVMKSSDKYTLVYDENSSGYSLYNYFSEVYCGECVKNIRAAYVADNGFYALITSSDEYNSVVEVYNDQFDIISRYNKNGYAVMADLNSDELMIVSVSSNKLMDKFDIEIIVSDIGAESAKHKINIQSGFPLSCQITDFGYAVVCSNNVYLFDKYGDLIGEYSFSTAELNSFAISDSHVFLLFENSGFEINYNAVCIDKNAKILYNWSADETIFDIELFGSSAFILTDNSVIKINENGSNVIETDAGDYECKLLALNTKLIYLCSVTSAKLLDFSDNN